MPTRIDVHVLQSVGPSNLNRDDTGSPKDALFGGVRRGRISSQALKRAARAYMRDGGLVPPAATAHRTMLLVGLLAEALAKKGVANDTAIEAATNVVGALGDKKRVKVKDGKTDVLLFVGRGEIDAIAAAVVDDVEAAASGKGKAFDACAAAANEALRSGGSGARDVALFGRMLAVLPAANVDAACQVAHALSTHRVEREFDFYTAVDDLNDSSDRVAADMVGSIEFNSACYYRFSTIDLDQLRRNLGGPKAAPSDVVKEEAAATVDAYVRAVVATLPTGKQNSFAAHAPPAMVLVGWRTQGAPRSLVNAFERGVPASPDGYVDASVRRLRDAWVHTEAAFGTADHAWLMDLSGAFEPVDGIEPLESVDRLARAVADRARA